jgi:hypothetical protein
LEVGALTFEPVDLVVKAAELTTEAGSLTFNADILVVEVGKLTTEVVELILPA